MMNNGPSFDERVFTAAKKAAAGDFNELRHLWFRQSHLFSQKTFAYSGDKKISTLSILLNESLKGNVYFQDFLNAAASQIGFCISKEHLQKVIVTPKNNDWYKTFLILVDSTWILHDCIVKQQNKPDLTEQEINNLVILAQNAMRAGYLKSFYVLGKFLLEQKKPQEACSYFAQVPKKCYVFFNEAQFEASNTFLNMALQTHIFDDERHQFLAAALSSALKLNNTNEKTLLIQKIAFYHLVKGKEYSPSMNFIDPYITNGLTENSNIEACFQLFEQFYAYQQLITQEEAAVISTEPVLIYSKISTSSSKVEAELPPSANQPANRKSFP